METQNCHRCRATTMAGDSDSNRAALPYRIDAQPLDPLGELEAVRGGRRTWTLHDSGAVFPRGAQRIRRWPAGSVPRQSVHADHRCTEEKRCGCERHRGRHEQCFAGCDLQGCRSLGRGES